MDESQAADAPNQASSQLSNTAPPQPQPQPQPPVPSPSSIRPPTPTTATSTSSTSNRIAEHLMHKNRLQEYTQRASLPLPIYHTANEGYQHAPKFRSTVLVDGVQYTSPNTFLHRKEAEQDVARLAFSCIVKKIKDEGCPLIREQDTVFCKSILNEFASKMQLQKPTYNTTQPQGLLPIFVSSLVFNGVTYTGETGRTKKEAEQLAARAVILSLMGNSGTGTIISEIVKSKVKLYAALNKLKNSQHAQGDTVPVSSEEKEAEVVTVSNNAASVTSQAASGMIRPHHGFIMPKPEPAREPIELPITFVHPVSEQALDSGSTSGKKRKKNKKKANKKVRTESQSPIATMPLNQASPYPVA
ncbi:double-stranded RNA-binding protein 4 isoform X1 [Hevea brasiliensis]|nr:double-stranded RNA-binding protein 4 isoform X1 [Hevea brasiliensis]